jgi:hypothetical protein
MGFNRFRRLRSEEEVHSDHNDEYQHRDRSDVRGFSERDARSNTSEKIPVVQMGREKVKKSSDQNNPCCNYQQYVKYHRSEL